MSKSEDIKRKVRSLLLRAADNRTPEEERKSARRIAEKLMERHGISEMEIWGTSTVDDIPEDIKESIFDDVMGHADKFVSMLEDEQEKAIAAALDKAEKYVQSNRSVMKEKAAKAIDNFIDGFFGGKKK